MKNKLKLILLVIFCLSIVACSPIQTKKEVVKSKYKENELSEGYYIYKEDGYFYPFFEEGTSENEDFFIWLSSKQEEKIPVLKENEKIVYFSNSNRPISYVFKKMKDFGWTIGHTFDIEHQTDGRNTISEIKFGSNFAPDSPIEDILNSRDNISFGESVITEINEKNFKPIMLDQNGFIKGLTKDAYYLLGFYTGTIYSNVELVADTHVFIQEEEYTTNSYIEDKKRFFYVEMPQGAKSGYYYLEKAGFFEYKTDSQSDLNEIEKENN